MSATGQVPRFDASLSDSGADDKRPRQVGHWRGLPFPCDGR